jgi:hypothetical protein
MISADSTYMQATLAVSVRWRRAQLRCSLAIHHSVAKLADVHTQYLLVPIEHAVASSCTDVPFLADRSC